MRSSTQITHTDPKAEWAALAVAGATQVASLSEGVSLQAFPAKFRYMLGDDVKTGGNCLNYWRILRKVQLGRNRRTVCSVAWVSERGKWLRVSHCAGGAAGLAAAAQ